MALDSFGAKVSFEVEHGLVGYVRDLIPWLAEPLLGDTLYSLTGEFSVHYLSSIRTISSLPFAVPIIRRPIRFTAS